eukprot:m.377698 g.377698  ORF g.377698 m.377698 type:complete len:322 (+) comp28206_c3_seq10:3060-4025(+)
MGTPFLDRALRSKPCTAVWPMPCRHTPLILERTSPGAMCVRPAAVVSSTLVMTWLPWGSVSKSNPNESFFLFFCKTTSDDLTFSPRWTTRFFPKFIRIPRITRLPTARNLCFAWTGNASCADSAPAEFSFTGRLSSFNPRATWNTSRVEAANRVSMSSWPAGGNAPFTEIMTSPFRSLPVATLVGIAATTCCSCPSPSLSVRKSIPHDVVISGRSIRTVAVDTFAVEGGCGCIVSNNGRGADNVCVLGHLRNTHRFLLGAGGRERRCQDSKTRPLESVCADVSRSAHLIPPLCTAVARPTTPHHLLRSTLEPVEHQMCIVV